MDGYVQDIIKRIESGESLELGDSLKNEVNAVMSGKLSTGDLVEVIRTGVRGRVIKKIKYDRGGLISPNGYTTVQIQTEHGKRAYAGRSLRLIERRQAQKAE